MAGQAVISLTTAMNPAASGRLRCKRATTYQPDGPVRLGSYALDAA